MRNYVSFGRSAHISVPDAGDAAFFLENCRVKILQVENAMSSRVPRVVLYGHNMDMHTIQYPRSSLPHRNFFRAQALKENRIFFLVGISGNDERKMYHFGQMAFGKLTDDSDNLQSLPCCMVDCTSDLVKRLKFSYLSMTCTDSRTAEHLPGEIPESDADTGSVSQGKGKKRKVECDSEEISLLTAMIEKNTSRFKVK